MIPKHYPLSVYCKDKQSRKDTHLDNAKIGQEYILKLKSINRGSGTQYNFELVKYAKETQTSRKNKP